MEISINFWIGFIVFVLIMLSLDLFVFHKKDTAVKVKEALLWSLFWIGLAVVFNIGVYFVVGNMSSIELGKQKALEFLTGYLIEESLSVDNLFVFIMIFGFFKIAPKFQHKILFWGIIGAIIMRAVFIFAGVALIQRFVWVMYIFGTFLIYTGIKMLFEKEDAEFDPNQNLVIRVFKKIMPVTEDMSVPRFFVKKNKIIYATPFFVVLLFIEVSDLIFAVDSIPAVLSVSKDPFIVYTSNIFAILGLRSLYFALHGIMAYFHYLKYALSGILTFIGIKMCLNELADELDSTFNISNFTSLGVIVAFLTASILLSIVVKKRQERKAAKLLK
ncbi:MAG TPA: TerC family protein [Paludibacter sp.]